MVKFISNLFVPIFKREIHGRARTQKLEDVAVLDEKVTAVTAVPVEDIAGYKATEKARRLDRWLDAMVRVSGSEAVFFTILTGLLAWAFLGISFGHDLNWQALISDIQAILSYIFDSMLMRQQMNGYDVMMTVTAELRSRNISHTRMFRSLTEKLEKDELAQLAASQDEKYDVGFERELPAENWFGRAVTAFSRVLGHVITVMLYWVCIFIWIGFGHYCGWSNEWELYINSATSALMVLVFSFLANIRERHASYMRVCLDAIFRVDSALELKLRHLVGDKQDNEVIVIPPPKVNWLQKVIYWYADVIGTLVGIVILIIAMIVWVALGPVMSFNSNWWLLIGTYAGLIGMNDGFVLRNVQFRLRGYEDVEIDKLDQEDVLLFNIVGAQMPGKKTIDNTSLSHRVSMKIEKFCGHEMTVLIGFATMLGLIAGSTAMKWNTTGQLLSNIPPSLIESFFMIILITGHNYADATKRLSLKHVYEKRLRLLALVNKVGAAGIEVAPMSPIENDDGFSKEV
jgi:low-affinity ferrous iron transport protein